MKKILQYTIVLTLAIQAGWCSDLATLERTYTQIECNVVPIQRIRPRGDGVGPQIPIRKGTSLNWSGYSVATNLKHPAKNSVNQVFGTWTVPVISASNVDAYSSIWVGIDGYSSSTVEQIGTEHDWDATTNTQVNYAWFEMYPRDAYLIEDFPLDIGDSISGSVQFKSGGTFSLTLYNNTKQTYTVIPKKYTKSKNAKRSSAEWIVEAPSDYSDTVLPLANFGIEPLSECMVMIKGHLGGIQDSNWDYDQLNMEDGNGIVKALTTDLTNGNAFNVIWEHE